MTRARLGTILSVSPYASKTTEIQESGMVLLRMLRVSTCTCALTSSPASPIFLLRALKKIGEAGEEATCASTNFSSLYKICYNLCGQSLFSQGNGRNITL